MRAIVIEILVRLALFARRFRIAKAGNVAMLFGLSLIPVATATGMAIDMSRALVVRSRLAHALDAAGLAVGSAVGMSLSQMQDLAQRYFDANYPAEELGVPGLVQVSIDDEGRIDLAATATLPTTIMKVAGWYTIDVGVTAEITRESTGLEVALVLDNTGSMANSGKIEALRQAATDLVTILFGDNENPPRLKVGIVPFADSVRLNPTMAVDNGWIDTTGASSVAQLNFTGGKYAYWLYTDPSGLANTPWKGCVEARPNGLEELDTAPSAFSPDTLWVPTFRPDEPHVEDPENSSWNPAYPNQTGLTTDYNADYITNYMSASSVSSSNDTLTRSSHGLQTGYGPVRVSSTGSVPGGLSNATDYWIIRNSSSTIKLATSRANALSNTAVNITSAGSGTIVITESPGGTTAADQRLRQQEWRKYQGRTWSSSGTSGPHGACGTEEVQPLVNSRSTLINKIPLLQASGYTHIAIGLGWGWRLLSPMAPFTEGVAYDDPEWVKALVLMTDGDNTMPGQNSINGSDYTAYGYAYQARLGAGIDTVGEIEAEQDLATARICQRIKDAEIRFYTIALMVSTNATKNMLRACATDPSLYFESPTADELRLVFQNIAQDLSNLPFCL